MNWGELKTLRLQWWTEPQFRALCKALGLDMRRDEQGNLFGYVARSYRSRQVARLYQTAYMIRGARFTTSTSHGNLTAEETVSAFRVLVWDTLLVCLPEVQAQ